MSNTKAKIAPKKNVSVDWNTLEFGSFTTVDKRKYTPNSKENLPCLELEHFEQETGRLLGWANSSNQKSTKNRFDKGQILFGKLRPYLKKFWLAKFDGVCSSEVWVLSSSNEKCNNEYLYCLIQSEKFIRVANVSSGSKMPRADFEYISNFPFLLPPPPEQRAIARVLSTWDEAITKTTGLIAQKEQRKKWLMQQLLTGKKRLKGFDKEKWAKVTFDEILEETKRPVKWDEGETYNLAIVKRWSLGLEWRQSLKGSEIKVKKLFTIKEGDFLISQIQAAYGAVGKVPKEFDGAKVSDLYMILTPKKERRISTEYLNQYSRTRLFWHKCMLSCNGFMAERLRLNFQPDYFLTQHISIPSSVKEQESILRVLDAADSEIQLLKTKLEQLKEQKKGLMQQLLTGRKRLKV